MPDTPFADAVKEADAVAVWCADVSAFQYVPPELFRYNHVPNEWALSKDYPVPAGDVILWIGENEGLD